MKISQYMFRVGLVALLALLMSVMHVQAGDDYIVISRGPVTLADGSTSTRSLSFLLPGNTSTSSATSASAVLQLMATHVNFAHNEIYINPPTQVCTDNGSEDANQIASVHLLSAHAANDSNNETFTEHRAFSSARLQPGIACTSNNNCLTSNVCSVGLCRNRMLICARTETGLADNDTNNVDNFSLHSLVLHFKTN